MPLDGLLNQPSIGFTITARYVRYAGGDYVSVDNEGAYLAMAEAMYASPPPPPPPNPRWTAWCDANPTPSVDALVALIRSPEDWPAGFAWDYTNPRCCGGTLGLRAWGGTEVGFCDFDGLTRALGLSSDDGVAVFSCLHINGSMAMVRPEHVAAALLDAQAGRPIAGIAHSGAIVVAPWGYLEPAERLPIFGTSVIAVVDAIPRQDRRGVGVLMRGRYEEVMAFSERRDVDVCPPMESTARTRTAVQVEAATRSSRDWRARLRSWLLPDLLRPVQRAHPDTPLADHTPQHDRWGVSAVRELVDA